MSLFPDIQINDDTEMIAGPYSTVALTERKGGRADTGMCNRGSVPPTSEHIVHLDSDPAEVMTNLRCCFAERVV